METDVRSGLWRSGHTNNNDDVEKKKEGGELSESFAHSWKIKKIIMVKKKFAVHLEMAAGVAQVSCSY